MCNRIVEEAKSGESSSGLQRQDHKKSNEEHKEKIKRGWRRAQRKYQRKAAMSMKRRLEESDTEHMGGKSTSVPNESDFHGRVRTIMVTC